MNVLSPPPLSRLFPPQQKNFMRQLNLLAVWVTFVLWPLPVFCLLFLLLLFGVFCVVCLVLLLVCVCWGRGVCVVVVLVLVRVLVTAAAAVVLLVVICMFLVLGYLFLPPFSPTSFFLPPWCAS